MDESTGHMEKHTYYSKRCIRAADRLFGCHARYFAVSTSPEMLNTPEFLVKDIWAMSNSGSTSDMRESLFLNKLHAEFDSPSEFSGKFSQLVSTGPVYINRGDSFVANVTATAFAGLWSISEDVAVDSGDVQSSSSICVRQHRRTVSRWAGTPISAADNPSQIVVAIADAMAALNEVYGKCKIFHGNISDRAILFRETTDGVKGILGEFDYAFYSGDNPVESPELMLFQSIHSLENPRAVHTRLDDWESILYLMCWQGTFGVNQQQGMAYVADPNLPILDWNKSTAPQIAQHKRNYMDRIRGFRYNILFEMSQGPLRSIAMGIFKVLFRHPDCHGSIEITDEELEEVEDDGIKVALREIPSIKGKHDPLIFRNTFENKIIESLLQVVAKHKQSGARNH
ncbi:hypothetical protein GGH94_006035 [Coemansia aciculifera]|uniref:Fungal-type protein kinase domain-containing protein n=1 Tax=Coemansia aciculifera TaxID=417176 RepID=A0A9W8IIW1_9FUNG|nr:hypothetical protein GGH94_006035 [Coemansia aciculifera]